MSLKEFAQPDVLRGALKNAFAFTACSLVAVGVGWEHPMWAVFPAIMLTSPFLGASVDKGLMRLAGTCAGSLAAILMVVAAGPIPFLFWILLACWIGALCAAASFDRYSNAFVVASYTTAIIAIPALLTGPAAEVLSLAEMRTLETAVGVLITLAVFALMWPQLASRHAAGLCKRASELSAEILQASAEAIAALTPIAVRKFLQTRGELLRSFGSIVEAHYFASREGIIGHSRSPLDSSEIEGIRTRLASVSAIGNILSLYSLKDLPIGIRDALRSVLHAAASFEPQRDAGISQPSDRPRLESAREALHAASVEFLLSGALARLQTLEAATTCRLITAAENLAAIPQSARASTQPRLSRREQLRAAIASRGRRAMRKGMHGIAAVLLGVVIWIVSGGRVDPLVLMLTVLLVSLTSGMQAMNFRAYFTGLFIGLGMSTCLRLGIPVPWGSSPAGIVLLMMPAAFLLGLLTNRPATFGVGLPANAAFLATIQLGVERSLTPSEFGFGVAVCFSGFSIGALVVNLIWPAQPRREFQKHGAEILKLCRALSGSIARGIPPSPFDMALISSHLVQAELWMRAASGASKDRSGQQTLEYLLISMQGFWLRITGLQTALSKPLEPVEAADLSACCEPVAQDLNAQLLDAIEELSSTETVGEGRLDVPEHGLLPRDAELAIQSRLRKDPASAGTVQILAIAHTLLEMRDVAGNLRRSLRGQFPSE